MILILMAGVFVVLLALALMALYLPAAAAERRVRRARLEEVQRFRGPMGAHEARLAALRANEPTVVSQRALSLVDKSIRAQGRRGDIAAALEGAGVRMRPEEWAIVQISTCLAGAAAIYLLLGSILGIPVGLAAGWFGCRTFLNLRRSRRERAFRDQIPDTLQLVSGSLQAGFSLAQALGTVVRQGTEPTAGEFNRALTEARLGTSVEDALDGVAERMACQDLAWVVIAIRVSREVGGNLAEVIATTVTTMRTRAELRGVVRTLSAEGRASAAILSVLPFFVGGVLLLMNPAYLAPMVSSFAGIAMLMTGAVLVTVGLFWLNRLIKIEV